MSNAKEITLKFENPVVIVAGDLMKNDGSGTYYGAAIATLHNGKIKVNRSPEFFSGGKIEGPGIVDADGMKYSEAKALAYDLGSQVLRADETPAPKVQAVARESRPASNAGNWDGAAWPASDQTTRGIANAIFDDIAWPRVSAEEAKDRLRGMTREEVIKRLLASDSPKRNQYVRAIDAHGVASATKAEPVARETSAPADDFSERLAKLENLILGLVE